MECDVETDGGSRTGVEGSAGEYVAVLGSCVRSFRPGNGRTELAVGDGNKGQGVGGVPDAEIRRGRIVPIRAGRNVDLDCEVRSRDRGIPTGDAGGDDSLCSVGLWHRHGQERQGEPRSQQFLKDSHVVTPCGNDSAGSPGRGPVFGEPMYRDRSVRWTLPGNSLVDHPELRTISEPRTLLSPRPSEILCEAISPSRPSAGKLGCPRPRLLSRGGRSIVSRGRVPTVREKVLST